MADNPKPNPQNQVQAQGQEQEQEKTENKEELYDFEVVDMSIGFVVVSKTGRPRQKVYRKGQIVKMTNKEAGPYLLGNRPSLKPVAEKDSGEA